MLKSHDILVWLKCFILKEEPWTIAKIAQTIGLSASEVHASLKRLSDSGLYSPGQRRVIVSKMEEFLIHGFKYVYPLEYQGVDVGIPTGVGGPVLSEKISNNGIELPVWASMVGTVRGAVVKPLHPKVPIIAMEDPQWYALLSVLDGLRSGKVREEKLAGEIVMKFLEGQETFTK